MKILLVNDYGTPTGGAELMVLALRDGLCRKGHDARVFTSSAQGGPGGGLGDYVCFGTTSRFRTLLQTMNLCAYHRLGRVLAEFQPDVVHVKLFLTQLSPLILPLLKDVPSLCHVVWYRPVCPLGTKTLPDGTSCSTRYGTACYRNRCLPIRDWLPLMVQMRLWRKWSSAFDLTVANSEAVKRHLTAWGIEPVEVIHNGVPVQPPRPPLSVPPKVAFAGRLVREKGADVLLRAFAGAIARIPDAELLLIGEGPERESLNRLIADLGISASVSMPGYVGRREMECRLSTAWVQVVASRWAEPFGLVAAEAMMRGTAVVASACGGLPEIIQDGKTGFLFPPGDVEALSGALINLLQNRKLAEQMGRSGRKVALAHFSESTFVKRFVRLYETLSQK